MATQPRQRLPIVNRMMPANLVRVRVGRQPINEDGHREPGSEFEMDRARAIAIAPLVEVLEPPGAPASAGQAATVPTNPASDTDAKAT